MGIRSASVTAGLLTLVMDDGRTFTLGKAQMASRLATDGGDLKKAAPRVVTSMKTTLGAEQFNPPAYKLDVAPDGSILGFAISMDAGERFV